MLKATTTGGNLVPTVALHNATTEAPVPTVTDINSYKYLSPIPSSVPSYIVLVRGGTDQTGSYTLDAKIADTSVGGISITYTPLNETVTTVTSASVLAGQTVDKIQPISLTVTPVDYTATEYKWLINGATVSGQTSATYTVTPVVAGVADTRFNYGGVNFITVQIKDTVGNYYSEVVRFNLQ
jgi:hypothetical protein